MQTIDQQLQDHKISPNRSDIIQALQSLDGEVRALAALKLANDKDANAVPHISDAFRNERVPEVEIQLAFALAELGEKSGTTSLKTLCDDKSQSVSIRLGAAQNLLGLHNQDCLSAVLEILKNNTESGSQANALGVLSGFREALKQHPQVIVDPIVKSLSASSPYVRISAALALENLTALSAIPELEFALAREQDEGVRAQMELDLAILKRKASSRAH
ncbi:MAG TPA: HEAT repeat domain-containing protein [Bryobacteraceae bacterium]|nr:HEAT repeat domain-containing protein [Bryobacteraceae bacterium]